MAVTIRDVAEAAGVSPMAVSKVLHGKGANVRVGKDTAELIRRVASELQYQPNELARSFRMRRTFTIGLVFEDWSRVSGGSQYFAHLLDGVTGAAFPAGYSVTICPQLVNVSSGNALNDGRFDGLIWAKFESTPENLVRLENNRTPIVLLHASSPEITKRGVHTVCCDNAGAMRLAVDHLVAFGHQRIAMVLPIQKVNDDETRDRAQGFKDAMEANGLEVSEEDILHWDYDATEFGGWWRKKPPHTALVLRSEAQGGSIIREAKSYGLSLPEDLSLIGFDSTEYCDTLSPRLTSISQPIERMAARATQILMSLIEGRSEPVLAEVYSCGFDVRESTAAI
ncbi:MAG: hypothetical protein BGO01_10395 [Armatimonadetes bacterium 55-13]|nr:LacI family DNA-binding transcriptional regulator [Armatimonadota bacterium]OJU62807.1 MAG: hypothetical protein BGO01_10395 [Armatimonadetes bacterium 55-13]